MEKGLIYCATSPSGKKYYGLTVNLEQRKKQHYEAAFKHNKQLHFSKALRKYGIEEFIWEVIEEYEKLTKIELRFILNEREQFWILEKKTYLREFGYNMTMGGDGVLGFKFNEEQYKKVCTFNKILTDSQKGVKRSEEYVLKYREIRRLNPLTDESKLRMSLAKKGKTYEEMYGLELAKKLKEKRHLLVHTDESKIKIGNIQKGRIHSEEQNNKMRLINLGSNNPMYGKHLSEETRLKISNSCKGKSKTRKQKTNI